MAVVLTACGSSNSGSNPGVSGTGGLILAPVEGATCVLEGGGTRSETLTTNALGQFSFTGLNITQGLVTLTCTDGTYADEATGLNTTNTITIRAATDYTGGSLNLFATPLTEIAYQQAQLAGTLTALSVTTANTAVADRFGLDAISITNTMPTDLNTNLADDSPAGQYAVVIAAISQLSYNNNGDIAATIERLVNDTGNLDENNDISSAIDQLMTGNSTAAVNLRRSQAAVNLIAANDNLASNTATIAVVSVTISNPGTSTTVVRGDTVQLTKTISPLNATTSMVTWESDNDAVASVDANGLVTASSDNTGSALITVTSVANRNASAMHTISVSATQVPVTGIDISPAMSSTEFGTITDLTTTITPATATNQATTWSSNNPLVANVDVNGRVRGTGVGSAIITVTAGNVTATSSITVTPASQDQASFTFPTTTNTAFVRGGTITQALTANPAVSLSYTSTGSAGVIDPNTGVVTINNVGTINITATSVLANHSPLTISYDLTVNPLPAVTNFSLAFTPIKGFSFTWDNDPNADHYELLENPDGSSGFSQVGADIAAGSNNHTLIVPLYQRVSARYRLASCPTPASHASNQQCSETTDLSVTDTLVDSIGYIKASNTDAGDQFGRAVSLSANGTTLAVGAANEDSAAGAVYVFTRNTSTSSVWTQQAYIKASNTDAFDQFGTTVSLDEDGNTLAVGAADEDSNASVVDGNQTNNSAFNAGAAYVFTRDSNNNWTQTAYVKASNTSSLDQFGTAVSLSANGTTLAVGASSEDSNATGVGGNQTNDDALNAGAVYVFTLDSGSWTQTAYIKASNTDAGDQFGSAISLSADGDILAVGALDEDSSASSINTGENDNAASFAGAAYIFTRDSNNNWTQTAYVKASNTDGNDQFGRAVSLSANGNTLAVGALGEDSSAMGIDGDQTNDAVSGAGAVYVFTRDSNNNWTQAAYIKASNTGAFDQFGRAVSLSDDGNTLAVGASSENSNATGVGGNQTNDDALDAGAVYVFTLDSGTWRQQAYVKASNTDADDQFGTAISLSADGDTLAVGTSAEDSNAIGVDGDQTNNEAGAAGAVYLY